MKVIIDNAIPYISGILEPYAEVVYRGGSDFSADDVRDADALIIRTRTRCNEALLSGSRVKLIATATIGFDHIDMEYCASHSIQVVTAAGCNAAAVLQWVAASLALLSKEQGWMPMQRVLGIVGVGHVGSLVEEYARRWGFQILRCDPPRKEREGGDFISLEELVSRADIITLHTPLDATTHHLIDERVIKLMRPDAVLLNASRGEVASTEALISAPQRLLLDVWEREPNLDNRLLEKVLVATSHIAGYSSQGKGNASAAVVAAVAKTFGLPIAGWYPQQVKQIERQPISWPMMCDTIKDYCDLEAETQYLKSHPTMFEQIRNNYPLREEYF